jgi:acyl carrier protein
MTTQALAETVKEMLAREAEVPVAELVPGARLESLGIDSLDVLKLAALFERRFDVRISSEELTGIETVEDVVSALGRKIGA